jgi:hypothetical protein
MGLTPAREAKAALMIPGGKANSCRDWSEAGFLQQRRRFAYLNQFRDPGAVCFDLSIELADALGQSDRFRAGNRHGKRFFTDPPIFPGIPGFPTRPDGRFVVDR